MSMKRSSRAANAGRLVGVAVMFWVAAGCGENRDDGPVAVSTSVNTEGDRIDPIFEDFAAATFSNPTVIDHTWLPLTPGNRLILDGTTVDDGEELSHRIVFVVTGLTKEIVGVETVAVWIEDYSDDDLVEVELAFYAQDDRGHVWFFGEHPEEYEDEEFVDAPTWIAGVDDAVPGIALYAMPEIGLAPYFQGWGPAVEWSDFGVVDSVGEELCVALDCYSDVLTIAESSLGEVGVFQLKSYAPGVGVVKVDFTGEDLSKELLEVAGFGPMSAVEVERYEALSLALEANAYSISPTVYGETPPLQVAGVD